MTAALLVLVSSILRLGQEEQEEVKQLEVVLLAHEEDE
jgi:hypothetical protein